MAANELMDLVLQFVNTPTPQAARPLIEQHPDLLSDKVAEAMGDWADAEDDAEAQRTIRAHRGLLQLCREIGIPRAFAWINSSPRAERPTRSGDLDLVFSELDAMVRRGDMRRRMQLCREGLRMASREEQPESWAELQMVLANSLAQSPTGNQAENLEQAIAHYGQALAVYTRDAFPVDWALVQNNMGNAYRERIHGERADNVEQAIAYLERSLVVYTLVAFPEEWARSQNNLGTAYTDRIRGDQAENLERAIQCFELSLEVYTREEFPQLWGRSQSNLGGVYLHRIRGEPEDNIEQAISHLEQALEVRTRDELPELWAGTQIGLGTAYRMRLRGEPVENVEKAIDHFREALKVFTRRAFPERWARCHAGLGQAYAGAWWREDREKAVEHYLEALNVYTRAAFPEQWAKTLLNLGDAYLHRFGPDRTKSLEQAAHCYRQALEVCTLQGFPDDHRTAQLGLGRVYLEQQQWGQAKQALQGALSAADLRYISAATPEARQVELRGVEGVPAELAYAIAQQAGNDSTLLQEAVVVLERNRARWLAEGLALSAGKPPAVPEPVWQGFTQAAEAIRQLQAEARLPDNTPGKRDYLALSPLLANARLALGSAVEQVRRYAADFLPETSFEAIRAALAPEGVKAAGVYLFTTEQEGLAFIVHPGGVKEVHLKDMRNEMLGAILRGWYDTYQDAIARGTEAAREHWREQVTTAGHLLWTVAIGPVAAALQETGLVITPGGSPPVLTLIPIGLLSLLPLHAAFIEDDATPTGWRYLLDDFAVRYAPSAAALAHAKQMAATQKSNSVLAVDEPRPVTRGRPLPNSHPEVTAIAGLFDSQRILRGEHATKGAALDALPAADVAHFACHAANDWSAPLNSGLLMANDQMLTVRELLELEGAAGRLISLSSCETGIVGTSVPDEAIGLPSALLQAGFGAALCSLWSVPDISTAMLMVRFYEFWRTDGLEPAFALRAAQRWLRDTTNEQKAGYFEKFVLSLNDRMADEAALEFYASAMESVGGLDAHAFEHPYWWAAFYITGA